MTATNNSFDITRTWKTDARWSGIERPYTAADVERLRGTVHVEHSLARLGAERLWELMQIPHLRPALGAMTGNQAIEMVEAGLEAIYVSGWQVAGDANTAGQVYPDQSLYPADSCRSCAAASTTRCCAPTRSGTGRQERQALAGAAGGRRRSRIRRHAERLRADEGND